MVRNTTRRGFLAQVGGIAGVRIALGSASSSSAEGSAKDATARTSGDRARQSFEIRHDCALQQLHTPPLVQLVNGDEHLSRNFIGNYSKGLPHNDLGEVDSSAYQILLEALKSGDADAFEKVPLGGTTELVNPLAGLAFDLEGSDSHCFVTAAPPPVASQQRADEMVELYWMALCRDVHFSDYESNPVTQAAVKELSSRANFQGPRTAGVVSPQTLFRGFTSDDVVGPYVSQLFQTPFSYGNFLLTGQVATYQRETDYLTSYAKWLDCQNGLGPFPPNPVDPQPRYYRNGRDLAAYVHFDRICEAFYNAALRLYDGGAPPNPGNPYVKCKRQSPFVTFGQPYFLTMHGEFALRALKAAWYQKWFVHRTLRPEAYGGLVEAVTSRRASYPIHSHVLNSEAAAHSRAKYGTTLLSSAYPEGCPQHPSYPQAHAAVAGACATFLKAAFDGTVQFNTLRPVQVASSDGLSLIPCTEADANQITVNGEINKLASNIGMARNFAGIHWRSDYSEGLRLGEAVAISLLRDQERLCCGERFSGFTITKFDGTTLRV